MRKSTAFAITTLTAVGLLLSGCSGNSQDTAATDSPANPAVPADPAADAAALAQVTVMGAAGQEPVVQFNTPFSVTANTARLVQPGDGDVILMGTAVAVNVITFDGTTGQQEGNSYGKSPNLLVVDETGMPDKLLEVVVGAQVGARVLLAGPTGEGTNLWALEIVEVMELPALRDGEEVALEAGLPDIDYVDSYTTDGLMPVLRPAAGAPPTELVVQPLIVGTGAKITPESKLVVQAAGWLWDGTPFTNSWEAGVGFPVTLSGTIQGWRQGLVGQPIGSQIMLIVPPDLAYGSEGRDNIPADSTLIFIIDIIVGI